MGKIRRTEEVLTVAAPAGKPTQANREVLISPDSAVLTLNTSSLQPSSTCAPFSHPYFNESNTTLASRYIHPGQFHQGLYCFKSLMKKVNA